MVNLTGFNSFGEIGLKNIVDTVWSHSDYQSVHQSVTRGSKKGNLNIFQGSSPKFITNLMSCKILRSTAFIFLP